MNYYEDLAKRLFEYSRQHQGNVGITAEAAEAILELTKQDRQTLLHHMEMMEQAMIRAAETRESLYNRAPGHGMTTPEQILLCNIVWESCSALYDLLRDSMRRSKEGQK